MYEKFWFGIVRSCSFVESHFLEVGLGCNWRHLSVLQWLSPNQIRSIQQQQIVTGAFNCSKSKQSDFSNTKIDEVWVFIAMGTLKHLNLTLWNMLFLNMMYNILGPIVQLEDYYFDCRFNKLTQFQQIQFAIILCSRMLS